MENGRRKLASVGIDGSLLALALLKRMRVCRRMVLANILIIYKYNRADKRTRAGCLK